MGNTNNQRSSKWLNRASIACMGAALVSLVGGIYIAVTAPPTERQVEPIKSKYTNTNTITSHASRETLSDMDLDGSWDLLNLEVKGKPRQLFYKEGFGPAQRVDAEVHIVKPDFFDNYNLHFPVEAYK